MNVNELLTLIFAFVVCLFFVSLMGYFLIKYLEYRKRVDDSKIKMFNAIAEYYDKRNKE